MQIQVSDAASQWFRDELALQSGDAVRFFGKVYGQTAVHDGFSLGMECATVEQPIGSVVKDGITYFASQSDEWFFADYDLQVDYDPELEEPKYQFERR
ncbi:iron-sulfur cluster biosynthesis protein [Latilactobacillus curvatus]|uniref:Iron-sulfur cluster biosynthesis protein n=1 Tax=Latilactobacillus curvatus TaxID=28038 RepID=A0ABM7QWB4_LATCU|nr:iron-sulfur cluster biosynthesis protein [Latilactobacillus curvatus]ANJ69719.1 iron-sulfur cluster biosynthesis protein [Latilactobacillus curvatus]AOO75106.1 iron-sulfur cluster biosynthesis protein [Latilactobacillus curvatus]ASN61666.1 iron-sulfur cluster biosynthesis protein [Latilactobacillus curvatus]KHO12522.1 hypothetical protein OA78_1550 [Latilactobacillus curvatus]MCT2880190.1 iron-sulfur cluster biosynthesis protein [Latilactobacillus curvatus]